MKRRAIVSVWDKTGVEEIARVLVATGHEILSTASTARVLRDAGIQVTDVADYTGAPEILGGRVKTLHPKIAGGILSTRKGDGPEPIDVVVCNLYPFEEGLKSGLSFAEMIELIDIGGVTLLRAAAKNYQFVTVVPKPMYYPQVIRELNDRGGVGPGLRRELAQKAFELTSGYDAAIARYLASLS